jgi:hypothetical protein
MQRPRIDNENGRFEVEKKTIKSTEQKSILLPKQYGKINKKKEKKFEFVCGYLDAVRETDRVPCESAGRAEIKISVRAAYENTRYVILYACRTTVKMGQSHIRAPSGGECDTWKRGFLLQY